MLRRLSALCLAVLVLSGTLTAGGTYLWCSMMQASVETCCCAPERSSLQLPTDEPVELHSGCCQSRGHGDLDQGRVVSSAIEVPPALPATALTPWPVLAVAIPVAAHTLGSSPCAARASPIRAGPRTASETCARLQVFRC